MFLPTAHRLKLKISRVMSIRVLSSWRMAVSPIACMCSRAPKKPAQLRCRARKRRQPYHHSCSKMRTHQTRLRWTRALAFTATMLYAAKTQAHSHAHTRPTHPIRQGTWRTICKLGNISHTQKPTQTTQPHIHLSTK